MISADDKGGNTGKREVSGLSLGGRNEVLVRV